MREFNVEAYLDRRVEETGGETRKVTWRGRKDAPDTLCMWPNGRHPLVELKKPGATPRPSQLREHDRLRKGGFDVWVLDNKQAVDSFIDKMTH